MQNETLQNESLKNFKLKLPSQFGLVTVDNIRKFTRLLPKLTDTFENTDIVNTKEYTVNNLDALARILSYVKYLGIISERRDKKNKRQYFDLTEDGLKLKEALLYFGDQEYEKHWKELIKKSDLYTFIITNEEFVKYKQIPRSIFKKTIGEQLDMKENIKRISQGEDFILELLYNANLIKYDNEYIRLPDKSVEEENETIEKQEIQQQEVSVDFTPKIQPTEGYTYVKDDDFELKIKLNDLSFALLKSHLNTLELKLKSLKKEKNQYGDNNDKK
jgi:hypothetical protein